MLGGRSVGARSFLLVQTGPNGAAVAPHSAPRGPHTLCGRPHFAEHSVDAGRAAFGQSSGHRDKWSHGLGDFTLQAGAFDYDTFMTLAGLCKPTSKIKTD